MTKEQLENKLYERMSAENETFLTDLKAKPVDEIISHAYEIACRDNLLMLFEYETSLNQRQLMFVLACTMAQRTGDERFYPPARQAAGHFAALQKQMGGHTDVYAVDNHSCVINAAMEQLAKPERSKEKPVAQRKQSEPER